MHFVGRILKEIWVLRLWVLSVIAFSTLQAADPSVEWRLPVRSVESPTFGRQDLATVQRGLGIEIGSPLDPARVDEGIRAVVKQGKIQTIRVEVNRAGDGIRVVLSGSRVRRVRKLQFTGIESNILDEVRDKLPVYEGEILDTRSFNQIKERLRNAYEARGYFFSDIKILTHDIGETGEADVEVSVEAGKPTVINLVTVSGGKEEENARFAAALTIKKGDRFSRSALESAVETLNRYFKANQLPTSKVEGTALNFSQDKLLVDINVSARLGERFQFIFSGNEVFDDRTLKELMTDEVLSQSDSVGRIGALIETKYRSVGYHFCKVTPQSSINEHDRLNVIVFNIAEGNKVIVDRVDFGTVSRVGDDSLESVFFANAPGVLARGTFWEDGIAEALTGMKREMEARGYFNSVITGPKIVFSEDKKGVQLLFDADLGTLTLVQTIEFKGTTYFTVADLKASLPFKEGESLNRTRVEEGRRTIVKKYQTEGFVDVRLGNEDPTAWFKISSDQKAATVLFDVTEGRQFFVGKISIEGTRKTEHEVILREMKLQSGDKLDPQKLKQSEEDISLLGLFSRVEIISSANGDDVSKRDLRILVRESKPGLGEVGFGGRYEDPRLRIRGFLGAAYRNLGGWNQTASARSEIGLPISSGSIIPFVEHATVFGYRAPYPFGLPLTLSAQIGLDSFEVATAPSTLQTRARIEGKIEKKVQQNIHRPLSLLPLRAHEDLGSRL